MTKLSAAERLRRFYRCFSGEDRVLVIIVADPDAIASAMALKRLLWRKVAHVTISNVNVIKRPDNLTLIRLLNLTMIHSDEVDATRFNRFVTVDSQPGHHEVLDRFQYDVIIDHHPDTRPRAAFADIRPKYGATATMMTEYLRAAKIKPSFKLATALCHGIKIDTDNFARKTLMEDVRAFQFLFRHSNTHLAWKMEHAELRLDFLAYFKLALQEMHHRKGRIIVHLGHVINPDICVLVADFFMRVDRVHWSIVSGACDRKMVIILRNDGIRKNAGKVAERSFGDLGTAGGHKSAARAEIGLPALGAVVDHRNRNKFTDWLISTIENKGDQK